MPLLPGVEGNAALDHKDRVIREQARQGPPLMTEPRPDPGEGGSNGRTAPPIGNALMAMLLFIAADLMFFAGLIGAFIVFRFGAESWPPPGLPRLPVEVTGVNTAILLASGATMARTWRSARRREPRRIVAGVRWTLLLGSIFLLVQGYEWARLLSFGLRLSSGVYGSTFYTLIGCHGVHVLGAVVVLLYLSKKITQGWPASKVEVAVKVAGMYWFLVVGLWPALYTLVYLH